MRTRRAQHESSHHYSTHLRLRWRWRVAVGRASGHDGRRRATHAVIDAKHPPVLRMLIRIHRHLHLRCLDLRGLGTNDRTPQDERMGASETERVRHGQADPAHRAPITSPSPRTPEMGTRAPEHQNAPGSHTNPSNREFPMPNELRREAYDWGRQACDGETNRSPSPPCSPNPTHASTRFTTKTPASTSKSDSLVHRRETSRATPTSSASRQRVARDYVTDEQIARTNKSHRPTEDRLPSEEQSLPLPPHPTPPQPVRHHTTHAFLHTRHPAMTKQTQVDRE